MTLGHNLPLEQTLADTSTQNRLGQKFLLKSPTWTISAHLDKNSVEVESPVQVVAHVQLNRYHSF